MDKLDAIQVECPKRTQPQGKPRRREPSKHRDENSAKMMRRPL
jgi:hypothetical protein